MILWRQFQLLSKYGGDNVNRYQNNLNHAFDSPEIYAAKLAFIGASISTLGDGLQAVAAGISLELLQKANNKSSQDQGCSIKVSR